MTREELHSTFDRLFAARGDRQAISTEELARVEAEMTITFPQAYLDFVTKYGAIYTPSILDLVTGGDSETAPEGASFDVQQFLNAEEIIKNSKLYWSGGMDSQLVGIASDCMGNMFAFRRKQSEPRNDDCALLFFDHDFCKVHEESSSFHAWLESFIRMSAAH
jgi:hypothetical protein